jgi:tRNA1Val (adenine37-N6)-methyltransferase
MFSDPRAVPESVSPLLYRYGNVRRVDMTADESVDGLFGNKVQVIQARRGYRASEDALILAWFVGIRPGELVLDVGTGAGAIAFGLAVREPAAMVVGLELQGPLADRARRGSVLNGLESRVSIIRGDARTADRLFRPGRFDVVVCNPPYHRPGRGVVNRTEEKALARHQLMLPCGDLFRVAAALLHRGGRLGIIYPAQRFDEMKDPMKDAGLAASRMLWIQPRKDVASRLVCVEARPRAGSGPLVEESLILYNAHGRRTPEATAILNGEHIPPRVHGAWCANSPAVPMDRDGTADGL